MGITDRVLKNILGDKDKDKTKNYLDCQPDNPKKQGPEDWFRQTQAQPRFTERSRGVYTDMARKEEEERRRRREYGSARESY